MNIATRKISVGSCLLAAVFFATCFMGCGSGNSPESAIANANRTNIQRLSNLYAMFQANHKFKGPKDEAEFKAYLNGLGGTVLEPMGIDPASIDQLFVCETDGEPFRIRYGVASGPRGSKEPVIFQSLGSGGMRMVGFLNMVQREVDETEYELLFGSKLPDTKLKKPDKSKRGENRSGGSSHP